MFGAFTFYIFQITAYMSFLIFLLALTYLISPKILSKIAIFKNESQWNSILIFTISIILFMISCLAIPEDFP